MIVPKKLEEALKARARKLGFKGERFRRYVYGTLQKVEARRGKRA